MESNGRPKFTRILNSGYSQNRRLPRLGKIRLGLKIQNGQGKQYPTETEYYVCPDEVKSVYGAEPTELDVMFPNDDLETLFTQKYAMYGSGSGLKCHGNGEQAERYDEKANAWKPCQCPCPFLRSDSNPTGPCDEQSQLMVMLPKVSVGGCYQITTRSYHSTVAVNSALDFIRGVAGRISFLPLILRRVPQEITHHGVKRTHYILNLVPGPNFEEAVMRIRQLEERGQQPVFQISGPIDEDPQADPPDRVLTGAIDANGKVDAEALSQMSDEQMEAVRGQLNAQQGGSGQPVKKADEKKFDLRFGEILTVIGEDLQLVDLKKEVLKSMGNPNEYKLTVAGQQEFVRRLKDVAAAKGVSLPL